MKKFIKNTSLFIILLFSFISLSKWPLKPLWGNPKLYDKSVYNADLIERADLIFIGSSHFYRQIDTPYINRKLLNQNREIFSYNLGSPSTFFPETFNVVDQLFEKQENKYYIIEFSDIYQIHKDNILNTRNTYWIDWKNFTFMWEYYIKDLSKRNLLRRSYLILSYVSNLLGIGQVPEILNAYFSKDSGETVYSDWGYFSLEGKVKKNPEGSIIERKEDLLKNLEIYQ